MNSMQSYTKYQALLRDWNLQSECLQVYMASKDYAGLIDACSRLGDAARGGDPQLWTVVLEHLTQQEEDVTQQVYVIPYAPISEPLRPRKHLRMLNALAETKICTYDQSLRWDN